VGLGDPPILYSMLTGLVIHRIEFWLAYRYRQRLPRPEYYGPAGTCASFVWPREASQCIASGGVVITRRDAKRGKGLPLFRRELRHSFASERNSPRIFRSHIESWATRGAVNSTFFAEPALGV
jgi:hypothetical protein